MAFHSDDFGSKTSVIQKQKQSKGDTSIVARLPCGAPLPLQLSAITCTAQTQHERVLWLAVKSSLE